MRKVFEFLWPDRYAEMWKNHLVGGLAALSAALYVVTVVALIGLPPGKDKPDWARLLLVLWAVVPPTWFWVEFHYIWRPANAPPSSGLDDFKYSQEVSRNIWLAFVALIAALYFGN